MISTIRVIDAVHALTLDSFVDFVDTEEPIGDACLRVAVATRR